MILAIIAILWLTLNPKFLGFGLGLGGLISSFKRDRLLNVCAYISLATFYLALQDIGIFGGKRHNGSLVEWILGIVFLGLVVLRAMKVSAQRMQD